MTYRTRMAFAIPWGTCACAVTAWDIACTSVVRVLLNPRPASVLAMAIPVRSIRFPLATAGRRCRPINSMARRLKASERNCAAWLVYDSMEWQRASMPVAATIRPGSLARSAGSTMATFGILCGLPSPS